jgi:hypothetical protein
MAHAKRRLSWNRARLQALFCYRCRIMIDLGFMAPTGLSQWLRDYQLVATDWWSFAEEIDNVTRKLIALPLCARGY